MKVKFCEVEKKFQYYYHKHIHIHNTFNLLLAAIAYSLFALAELG